MSICAGCCCCSVEDDPKKKVEPFVISHEAPWRSRWDLFVFFIIIFLCITTPLRIGFMLREWKQWAAFDIIVDLVLIVDIVIRAFTTFELEGETIKGRKEILMRYLTTWLVFDVLSVIPGEVVCIIINQYHPVARANRLIRVARLISFFMSWEKNSALKPSIIRIIKSAFIVLFVSHFDGCLFHLVCYIQGEDTSIIFVSTPHFLEKSFLSRYLRSFFWSFVTLTGYSNPSPETQIETIFIIYVTMTGISLFASVIGTVGSLVTTLDSSALYFRQKMDGINDYMMYKRIPEELQREVVNYYSYMWKSGKGLDQNEVLEDLPSSLQTKMSLFLNSEIVKKVSLFEQCKDDTMFIGEIVKNLKTRVCLPNSFIVKKGEIGTEMFFISRGELNVVVEEENKVVFTLRDGGFFGEIALLYDTKRTATIVARTYCDMFILTKTDFKKVMKKFPEQSRGIKEIAKQRFQAVVEGEKKKEEAEKQRKAEEARKKIEQRLSPNASPVAGAFPSEGDKEPQAAPPPAVPPAAPPAPAPTETKDK